MQQKRRQKELLLIRFNNPLMPFLLLQMSLRLQVNLTLIFSCAFPQPVEIVGLLKSAAKIDFLDLGQGRRTLDCQLASKIMDPIMGPSSSYHRCSGP